MCDRLLIFQIDVQVFMYMTCRNLKILTKYHFESVSQVEPVTFKMLKFMDHKANLIKLSLGI